MLLLAYYCSLRENPSPLARVSRDRNSSNATGVDLASSAVVVTVLFDTVPSPPLPYLPRPQ